MQTSMLILANGNLGEAVTLMIVGMGVVFAALILVGLMLGLLRKLGEPTPKAKPQSFRMTPMRSPSRAQAATQKAEAEPKVDPHLLVVLTAAATAMVHGPVRVRRVQFISANPAQRSGWAAQGRVMIHASHNTQQRKR